jgi:hypothetical protein
MYCLDGNGRPLFYPLPIAALCHFPGGVLDFKLLSMKHEDRVVQNVCKNPIEADDRQTDDGKK